MLLAIYIFKDKLVLLLDGLLKFLLVICLLLALTALFFPAIYKNLAGLTLENAGILQNIRNFDKATDVNQILSPGEQLLNDFNNLITGSQNTVSAPAATKGQLETNFYPYLVEGLGNIYIILALILSLGGIAGIVYLSFTTSALTETEKLQDKFKKLETRLVQLEKTGNI